MSALRSALASRVNARICYRPWTLEYLYVDLGSFDTVSPFPAATPRVPETGPFIGAITTHTHFTDNIVRVGLNYKFGNYYAPVVAK
jgi:hypothetical protein